MANPTWRVIYSPAATGAENMALDEAILESVAASEAPTTLRLYAWAPPCLSIGHAQSMDSVDLQRLGQLGWDLVRRPTGGKAILHTDELTYSVIGLAADPLLAGGVLASYERLSAGLRRGLQRLGLGAGLELTRNPSATRRGSSPVCFAEPGPFELTWGGRKILGSAQLRRAGAVLQHGSLPLEGDLGRICSVLQFPDREQASRSVRSAATTLEQASGKVIGWETAAEELANGFQEALGLELIEGSPSRAETERGRELVTGRYSPFADPIRQ